MSIFQENFSQWGRINNVVVLGNNDTRVIINDIFEENNELKVIATIIGGRIQTVSPAKDFRPDFCLSCQRHSFVSLICCEGCQHRQCLKCMERTKNVCQICN